MPTRRATLLAAVAAALAAATPAHAAGRGTGSAASRSATPRSREAGAPSVRLTLPAPGGPHVLGTVSLRLVDTSRPDPWVPGRPYRELMVDVRYPARPGVTRAHPRAPHMRSGAAAAFAALNNLGEVPADRVDWAATLTHAHEGAPADLRGGPYPVVLYSPGVLDPRTFGTTLTDDLASRGHMVVTVDHTYDATAVEFPGDRVEHTVLPARLEATGGDEERIRALLEQTVQARVADLRFVLDALPSALPKELRRVADLSRTGMFGHSAGGFAALQTMHDDRRLRAAADLDGVLAYVQEPGDPGHYSTVARNGLDRPFLLMGKDGNDLATVPSWGALARNSGAWHRCVTLPGSAHGTYSDAVAVLPRIARALDLPRDVVTAVIGTISPARAVVTQRDHLAAFFARSLRDPVSPAAP
ncbi:hydrolase [Streptomyces capillispiralis]|uniref:alpha/beta hydrolase n=1 Tax=Streptomyces capillispiralis TaxID=68182 RepID=UPI00369787C3